MAFPNAAAIVKNLSGWIKNFRERLKNNSIEEREAVDFFKPHLMSDYSNIGEKITEFFAIQR